MTRSTARSRWSPGVSSATASSWHPDVQRCRGSPGVAWLQVRLFQPRVSSCWVPCWSRACSQPLGTPAAADGFDSSSGNEVSEPRPSSGAPVWICSLNGSHPTVLSGILKLLTSNCDRVEICCAPDNSLRTREA